MERIVLLTATQIIHHAYAAVSFLLVKLLYNSNVLRLLDANWGKRDFLGSYLR